MRQLRLVSKDEFGAFLSAHVPLTTRQENGTTYYLDGDWPEGVVAAVNQPSPPKRPRPSGWRVLATVETTNG